MGVSSSDKPIRRLTIVLVLSMGLTMIRCSSDNPTEPTPNIPDTLSLQTSRVAWHIASTPEPIRQADYKLGRVSWYTPRDLLPASEIWGDNAHVGESTVRTLRLIFEPAHFRIDTAVSNSTDTIFDTTFGLPSWAGVMRYIDSYAWDALPESLEVRLHGNHGVIHVDIGQISEDLDLYGPADHTPFSEDGSYNGAANGFVEAEEDIGLDGLPDKDEPGYDALTNPDPNGDNWFLEGKGRCPLPPNECATVNWDDESVRYRWINGTEGNRDDPLTGNRPDQEPLRQGRGLNEYNAYLTYTLDLGSVSFLVEGSEFNGWRTYKIPIVDTLAISGSVNVSGGLAGLSQLTHVRVWLEASPIQQIPDTIDIADWRFSKPSTD